MSVARGFLPHGMLKFNSIAILSTGHIMLLHLSGLYIYLPSFVKKYRMEKLLVVLLVAAATVCFLTNLLVLIILIKRRKRKAISSSNSPTSQQQQCNEISNSDTRWNQAHTFRYQIVMSQCLVGIFASAVVIYPLKVGYITMGSNMKVLLQTNIIFKK